MAKDAPNSPEADYQKAKAILERMAGLTVDPAPPPMAPVNEESDPAPPTTADAPRPRPAERRWGEDTFRSFTESLPDAVVAIDGHGLIVLCNRQAEDLFGYRHEELLGLPIEALVPERLHDAHLIHRAEFFRNPRSRPIGVGMDLRGRRKDGGEIPVEISLTPVRTEEGVIVFSLVRDLRQRKRDEAKFRNLVEAIPAVTFIAPLDENVSELYVSPQIEELLGFTQKEWLEDPVLWHRQLHPDDRDRWTGGFAPTCATGETFRDIYRFIAKDGRTVWVQGSAKLVRDETGRPLFLEGLAFDVTGIKEAELANRRLAAIVEFSQDAIIGKTLGGTVTSWNHGAEAIYGYDAAEMVGRPISTLVPADRPDEIPGILARVRRGEAVEHYETVRVRKDGRHIDVSLTVSPIRNAEGTITGASAIARDITQRKRDEARLHERARLSALEASVAGTMTRPNRLSEMLQECTEALVELTGVAFARIWGFNETEAVLELRAGAGLTGNPHGRIPLGEFGIGLIGQEKRPYHTNDVLNDPRVHDQEWARREGMAAFAGYPLIVDDQLVGVLAVFAREPLTDTTLHTLEVIAAQLSLSIKRKLGEEELEQRVEQRTQELADSLRELDEKGKELEKFAEIASHDFRKPLRSLLNWPHKLAEEYGDLLDDRGRDWLRRTLVGGESLRRLIEDVSTYRKVLPRDRVKEPVNCNAVVAQVTENLDADIRETAAVLTVGPLPTVAGHPTDLVLLFQNLIGNALKYRAEGVAPEVSVSARREEDYWFISVRDNGIGMESKYLERIFVLGERLHGESKYPGSGFGLAICEKIVRAHGGRIWAESAPGAGSTFHFTLPANADRQAAG